LTNKASLPLSARRRRFLVDVFGRPADVVSATRLRTRAWKYRYFWQHDSALSRALSHLKGK
jgi:DNA-binding winged helix-turn-helix (wHTH) protein